ncbi:F-box/FBD/LRR-repeat protein At1g13570-like [Silene latifolia]|uniref:F-box/FBD/LRR-repeat protein At1g13570-like n=1 Tax=Silene latifolia TaxID=37657 RepID=UPI003D783DB3
MKFCPQKHICSSKDDRDKLSELQDDLIVNILSYMPIVDAVRTVLLRRFGNLWTFIHTLNFDYDEFRDKLGIKGNTQHNWICRFIRNVLTLHQNPSINTFNLRIEFDKAAVDDLSEWFRFALDRQAKEIRLSDGSDECDFYIDCSSTLRNLTSQFLVTLELENCKLEGELQVNLRSLKKLSLYSIDMSDEIFEGFISGCPSLQELVIEDPYWTNNLSFSAPNIEKLSLFLTCEVQSCLFLTCVNCFSINFPNLISLYLEIDIWELNIIDVSSVRDIYVKYFEVSVNLHDDESFTIKKMFGKLENIEVFQLSNDASKPFLYAIQDVPLLRHKWKRIVLQLQELSNSCLSGIYYLMRSLKQLEELDIYTTKAFDAGTNLHRLELPSPYVTPQLKTITLHGYGKTWRSQLQLIEFLLKSAAALDKLVIVPMKGHRLKAEEELEFVKNVANFPRASPSARVVFA